MTDEELIRAYYDAFNARRLEDAAALLAEAAHIEHPDIDLAAEGSASYRLFAERWLAAFPDLTLTIERIDRVRDDWHEVYLIGEGTHQGTMDMGALGVAKPTFRRGRMRLRHLVQIRDARITSSLLSFDTNDLIRQVAR